jgi:hypothetical protein
MVRSPATSKLVAGERTATVGYLEHERGVLEVPLDGVRNSVEVLWKPCIATDI